MNPFASIVENNNRLLKFSILLALLIKSMYLVFFCYIYTDSDQTMQWLAASEYALGTFNTLFFYGQDYNPMIEALFASPLVYIGFPVYFALPTITTIMGLTPWIFTVYILYKNNHLFSASILMLILAALPYEFHIVNAISRGWVHGLFVATVGLFLLFNTKANYTFIKISKLIVAGLLGGVGTYICPNVVLYFIPFVVYWWILVGEKKIIIGTILGACYIAGVIVTSKLCSNFPYHSYIKHWNSPFSLSFEYFVHNLKSIYLLFNGLFPLYSYLGIIIFISIFIFTWHLFKKKNFLFFWPMLVLIVLVLITLFTRKSNNGQGNPFFPYIRFYLAIPILFYYFFLNQYNKWFQIHRKKAIYLLLLAIGIQLFLFPLHQIKYTKTDEFVRVVSIKKICKACDSIDVIMKERHQDKALIFKKCDEIAFGCAALGYKYHFLYPEYERHKLNHELFEKTDTSQLLHISYENYEYVFR
jgi:uncharacterized membrane protein